MGVVVVEDGPGESWRGLPPALADVGNRQLLHHVLDAVSSAGVEEIVVTSSDTSAGDVAGSMEHWGVRAGITLSHIHAPEVHDFASGMRAASPFVGDSRCIVHRACGLLDQPLAPLIERAHSSAPDVTVFVHRAQTAGERLSDGTRAMLHLAEFDRERAPLGLAGACLLGPSVLDRVASAWRVGDSVDLTMLFEHPTALDGAVRALAVHGWRGYWGDPLDLLELNRIVLDNLPSEVCRHAHGDNRIEGRVWIEPGAKVRSSVVTGPAVIAAGAEVVDAYIGPYTAIGAGARVVGAEIERSIVACGASVLFVGGRVTSSVIGRGSRIFRDFALPRAFRLQLGDGAEVALC